MPEPDEWQPVIKSKRPVRASPPATIPVGTELLVYSRPDRACKRPRGSYDILADLDEDQPASPAPAVLRGRKRDQQQALTPAVPETVAGPPLQPVATTTLASQADEAPSTPLLCSGNALSSTLSTVACEPCADAQSAAETITGRRRKKLKEAQDIDVTRTIATEQQLSVRNARPPCNKRKAGSQQILQLAGPPGPHTPAASVASQPNEAAAIPLLCSSDNLLAISRAAAHIPSADSQPNVGAAPDRHQKKLKTAQATALLQMIGPDQQPSVRHARQPRSKRKAITQHIVQPHRRSTRQRIHPRVFDPSDPAAIAGYVRPQGVSPDMQSSLPFDTG